jgi:hypothetical protein
MHDTFAEAAVAPTFVVVDNVNDLGLIDVRVPARPASTVLITMRRRPRNSPWLSIPVDDLTEAEVEAMIRSRFASVSPVELNMLEVLRGRAIALELACSYLRNTSSESARMKFLVELQTKIARVLDHAAAELDEASLVAVYREVIGELESHEYDVAIRLLQVLACLPDFGMDEFEARSCFAEVMGQELELMAYRSAKAVLLRYGLVEFFEGSPVLDLRELGTHGPDRIRIHPVTRSVLREIFGHRLVEIAKIMVLLEVRVWRLWVSGSMENNLAHIIRIPYVILIADLMLEMGDDSDVSAIRQEAAVEYRAASIAIDSKDSGHGEHFFDEYRQLLYESNGWLIPDLRDHGESSLKSPGPSP